MPLAQVYRRVVWRGMRGLSDSDLTRLLGQPPAGDSGDAEVSWRDEGGHWTGRQGVARVYAAAAGPNERGGPWMVLMRGTTEVPGKGQISATAPGEPVTVDRVWYTKVAEDLPKVPG